MSRRRKDWIIHVERDVMENSKLSCGARVLFAVLRGYQGKNSKEPFPSIETLQGHLGERDQIYGYLKELYGANLLRWLRNERATGFCAISMRLSTAHHLPKTRVW